MSQLSTLQQVQLRIQEIDDDLAVLQNEVEDASWEWYCAKRDRELAEQVQVDAYVEGVSQSALDRAARARDADAWCWK